MRRRLAVLLLAIVASGLAAYSAASAPRASAADPVIAVDMAPATPGIQATLSYPADTTEIRVDIVARNVSNMGAFEFGIAIPFGVQYIGYSVGPLTGSTGRTPSCLQTPAKPQDRVYIACATTGPVPPGPSGAGVLASLRFRPSFPQEFCLQFFLVEVADVPGNPEPTLDESGCASPIAAAPTPEPLVGDVDGDCTVSVMDLTLIGSRYGYSFGSLLYVAAYDLNHNGAIDIFDLQTAAFHFGARC